MSTLMAFTAQQTARLSGISDRMLRYWEQTGVFNPEYLQVRKSGPFRKIYTFRDLVTLRTLATIRTAHGVTLEQLRRADEYLRQFSHSPWTDLKIRLLGTKVVFLNPETGIWSRADGSGQLVMTIDLGRVSRESETAARALMQRPVSDIGQIARNRYVMHNAWVFAGTRIPVTAVLDLLEHHYADAEVLRQYPSLSQEDLDAARRFQAGDKAA